MEMTERTTRGKTENKTTDTHAAEEKLQEISLKESANEGKGKTEALKDVKESKGSKIDPSLKTRRSSKSPLLEKLLSPGRRSRRSQKEKTKTGKDSSETTGFIEDVAEVSTSKSEGNTKAETKIHAEKLTDSSKIPKVEAKVDVATKSKGKSEEGQKKSEKAESSKGEAKTAEGHHHGNEALSNVTGAFDIFKFGGKKSK
jgi:hypothetical protein